MRMERQAISNPSSTEVHITYDVPTTPLYLIEWAALKAALVATRRNQSKAAKLLGVSRSAFREKLKRYEARDTFVAYCEGCSLPILAGDGGYCSDEHGCYTCHECNS